VDPGLRRALREVDAPIAARLDDLVQGPDISETGLGGLYRIHSVRGRRPAARPGGAQSALPWVGLLEVDQPDLSTRYREIMAQAHRDREIVETIESIRHSA
jgi:hypothetical protein